MQAEEDPTRGAAPGGGAVQIDDPPLARFLLSDTRAAWVWLIIRVYVGWQWLVSGLEKLTGYSIDVGYFAQPSGERWVFNGHPGSQIVAFANGAIQRSGGDHPQVTDWYAWFLQHVVIPNAAVFAYLVTFGELLVGIALIAGLLTGVAAAAGLFMNMNYLLAGTVGSNPVMGALAVLLVLAWRVAGWYGLDRWVLPLLGTPWQPGPLVERRRRERRADGRERRLT